MRWTWAFLPVTIPFWLVLGALAAAVGARLVTLDWLDQGWAMIGTVAAAAGVEPGAFVALSLLAVVPLAAVELAKAGRWYALCGPRRPSYARCLRALLAGQATNALAPVRAGDAVRLALLAAEGGALAPATAALAGAKALDALVLAAIATMVAGSAALAHAGWGLAVGGLVTLAGVVLALRGSAARGWLEAHPLARKARVGALVEVAAALREPRVLLGVASATAGVWLGGLAANALVLAAVGVEPTVELAARVLVAGYLVGLAPSPPARLGVFEAGIVAALVASGVPAAAALAAAVTLHVCQLVELGMLMVASLGGRRWSWSA
jgi:uncharacterized membrane protein YbhN (UPF0104 family)